MHFRETIKFKYEILIIKFGVKSKNFLLLIKLNSDNKTLSVLTELKIRR